MDEQANKPTTVAIVLASGQVLGPVPLVGRDENSIVVQVSVAMKLKSGKAVERDVARLIPLSSVLFMDILPDEGTEEGTNDERAQS